MPLVLNIVLFILLGLSVAILLGVVFALIKKRVDKDEDSLEIMAGVIEERLHWPELAAAIRKLSRLNLVGAIRAAKAAWARFSGEKIWALITKNCVKGIPAVLNNVDHEGGPAQRIELTKTIAANLPGLMQADDTSRIINDVIEAEALGFAQSEEEDILIAEAAGRVDKLGWGKLAKAGRAMAVHSGKKVGDALKSLFAEIMEPNGEIHIASRVAAPTLKALWDNQDARPTAEALVTEYAIKLGWTPPAAKPAAPASP